MTIRRYTSAYPYFTIQQNRIKEAFLIPLHTLDTYHSSVTLSAEPADNGLFVSTDETADPFMQVFLPMAEEVLPAVNRELARKYAEMLCMVVQNSPIEQMVGMTLEGMAITRKNITRNAPNAPVSVNRAGHMVYVHYSPDPNSEVAMSIHCRIDAFPFIANLLPNLYRYSTL